MYLESNRRSSARRADDDFLRRMMGGDLSGNGYPVVKAVASPSLFESVSDLPQRDLRARVSCNGNTQTDNGNNLACPTTVHAPSLAMVYSPVQCWRNLYDPVSGLSRGTIFAELDLPLEAVENNASKEVKTRRPM